MRKLEVVVGGQYGSEAKGHIVQRLTEQANRDGLPPTVIRVAGPNAGHTGYSSDGTPWALRQVPVAAVVDGPAVLGIADGSEIDPAVLFDEIDSLRAAGLMDGKMLWVSEEATIISAEDHEAEGGQGGHLQSRLGSTGKGIGSARSQRIWRKAQRVIDSEFVMEQLDKRGVAFKPARVVAAGGHTIIEGTQGYGLGLHAGHYPQCTSSDCRAIDFLAMAGVNPWEADVFKVHVVARVYPIRVAGNSGPLKNETTWEYLGLPEERTTVTKKVRRVGLEDWDLVRDAVFANGGAGVVSVALTMLDQKFPELAGKPLDVETVPLQVLDYVKMIEDEVGAPIEWVTTGPNTATNIAGWEI